MTIKSKEGFLDRTLRNLKEGWKGIAGASYDATIASTRPGLPDEDLEKIRQQMAECLEGKGGEVSARSRAAALGHVYLALNEKGKKRFLNLLATNFEVDLLKVNKAITDFQRNINKKELSQYTFKLKKTLESPRIKLLTQFNDLPEGVKFLVDMRADLITFKSSDQNLLALESDLKSLLASWFDVGFLELRRITWSTSSAALLEKLITYEAVHAIQSWNDLKNRLDSDRRCFAYFHPRMPDEPIIFVEVALVHGMTENVYSILNQNAPVIDPNKSNTAIFYSISNAQKGLSGISFGNFLIKRVVSELTKEFDGLKVFATLSPIPGFLKWLTADETNNKSDLLKPQEIKKIKTVADPEGSIKKNQLLTNILNNQNWIKNEELANCLKSPLLRLAAYYIINEKGLKNRALDPVANFHLFNGAIVERLNWMGDISPNGLTQSAGIMVNYLYDLNSIEDNHEIYSGE